MQTKKRNIAFVLTAIILSLFVRMIYAQDSQINNDKSLKNNNITITDSEDAEANVRNKTSLKPGSTLNREEKINYKNYDIFLAAGIGIMRGHTTYQIGNSVDTPDGSYESHFPLSELVFPLNTYMASLGTSILYRERLKSGLKFRTNIRKKTDNMKDSDWGVPWEYPEGSGEYWWYGPDHLDIYSESKTEVEAFILDFDILFKFYKNTSGYSLKKDLAFLAGIGYIFQRYYFECRLIQQYDYRYDAPEKQRRDAIGDGSVGLTYEVITHIPYIKLAAELVLKDRIYLNASLGYSPYVKLVDNDNHILNSKISKAKCEGTALIISAGAKYMITDKFFAGLNLDFISIETEGRQKQYDEGVWSATIDQKNFSQRQSLELSAGYIF